MKDRTILLSIGLMLLAALIVVVIGGLMGLKLMEVLRNDVICPTQADMYCNCIVDVVCCCPTETPTPTETSGYVLTPTRTVEPTDRSVTPTRSHKQTPTQPSPSRTPSPTKSHTSTATASAVPTATTKPTVVECECVWICWNFNPGKEYWKNYCCPPGENYCAESHLKKGDSYLGRCQHGEETHPDDGYCLP